MIILAKKKRQIAGLGINELAQGYPLELTRKTIAALVGFSREKAVCMHQLLSMLVIDDFCHAALCFSLEKQNERYKVIPFLEVFQDGRKKPNGNTNLRTNKLWRAISANHALYLKATDAGRDIKELYAAKDGVIIRIPSFDPDAIDRGIVVCLFRNDTKLAQGLFRTYAQILFKQWFDACKLKSLELIRLIRDIRNDSGPNQPKDFFGKATNIQSLLSQSRVFEALEKIITETKDEERQYVAEEFNKFNDEWHFCANRWQGCKQDSEAECNFLSDWYCWRLNKGGQEGQYLEAAVSATKRKLQQDIQQIEFPLRIDSIISKYFLAKIMESFRPRVGYFPNNTTENYNDAKDKFGQYVLQVLFDLQPTPESIEAKIWSISEYAYNILKVDRRLHLASHMRHGARGEPSLHMMKEFYRDHFFHTIEVCFLGHLLITCEPEGKDKAFQGGNFLKEWYITALLHDIGYAVDVCDSLSDWLKFFVDSGAFYSLGRGIDEVLKHINNSDDFKIFYKKQRFEEYDEPWKDHGLVGAHNLDSLVKDIKKTSNIVTPVKAIDAIAKHNCQRINISYEKEPLSALLVLCDTLQTWCRPQFEHFSLGPAWMMSAIMNSKRELEKPEATVAKLLSNIQFKVRGGNLVPWFNDPLVLRLEFGPEVNHDSFVFNIWLDATCNFQRIDFRSLPYNIIVQIVTPTYKPPKGTPPQRQMDRLKDAAIDTHMAYLDNWFPKEERRSIMDIGDIRNNMRCATVPITYYVDNNKTPTKEMLSFGLNKMTGNREFMTESISRFRKDIKHWKRYREDKLFVGDYSPWCHNTH